MPDTLVSVSLSGAINTGLADSTIATDCACDPPQPSASFNLTLQTDSRWGDAEASSRRVYLNSAAAFVAIGMPPVGAGYQFLGRLLYFKSLERDITFTLRVTFADSGVTDIPTTGMALLEPPATDEITALSIQGVGSFEYLLVGRVEAV